MNAVEITNVALGLLVPEKGISTFDDESAEARLSKTLFAPARDAVLEDRIWTFAVGRYILSPEAATPSFGYEHQFGLPSEIVRVHRVDDGSGDYTVDWKKEGRKLLSDADKLYVTAVSNSAGPDTYSPNFCLALAYKLASLMAIPLTQNRQLQADMASLYEMELKNAGGTDGAQGKNEKVRSDWLSRARR